MRDHPILFDGAKVCAILAGQTQTQTQTRRVVKSVGGDNCLPLRIRRDGALAMRAACHRLRDRVDEIELVAIVDGTVSIADRQLLQARFQLWIGDPDLFSEHSGDSLHFCHFFAHSIEESQFVFTVDLQILPLHLRKDFIPYFELDAQVFEWNENSRQCRHRFDYGQIDGENEITELTPLWPSVKFYEALDNLVGLLNLPLKLAEHWYELKKFKFRPEMLSPQSVPIGQEDSEECRARRHPRPKRGPSVPVHNACAAKQPALAHPIKHRHSNSSLLRPILP